MARRHGGKVSGGILRAVAVIVIGLLFGCRPFVGQSPVSEELRGTSSQMPAELQAMCSKDGGVRVYEHASKVDGYAILPSSDSPTIEQIATGKISNADVVGGCFPCFRELIRDKYRYIETYFAAPRDRVREGAFFRGDFYVSQTGLYRYSLVSRADNPALCERFDQVLYLAQKGVVSSTYDKSALRAFVREYRNSETVMRDFCIYAKPISRFSAPFVSRLTRQVVWRGTWHSQPAYVYQHRDYVEARDGKRLIAEAISYVYWAGPPRGKRINSCGGEVLPPIAQLLKPN